MKHQQKNPTETVHCPQLEITDIIPQTNHLVCFESREKAIDLPARLVRSFINYPSFNTKEVGIGFETTAHVNEYHMSLFAALWRTQKTPGLGSRNKIVSISRSDLKL